MTKSIYTKIKEILEKYNLSHKITDESEEWINKKDTLKVRGNGYIVVYEKGTHPVKDQIGYILFNNNYEPHDNCWMSDWSLNDHPYSKEIDSL
tara:strand:+ start:149 stop:427 length:279 start_codon:yes stop_codon:yes gene_type:complete